MSSGAGAAISSSQLLHDIDAGRNEPCRVTAATNGGRRKEHIRRGILMRWTRAGRRMRIASMHRRLAVAMLVSVSPVSLSTAQAQDGDGTWLNTITVVGTRTERAVKESPR